MIELDVTNDEHLDGVAGRGPRARRRARRRAALDRVRAAVARSVAASWTRTWDDVSTALHVSTYSYKSLAMAALPLMSAGGSIVGLTFDATEAWPVYDWMGVAKAGLESANRYLASYLGQQGIRVNLVSAGPLRTMAAKSIPGFEKFEDAWALAGAARLGPHRPGADREGHAARCCRTGSRPRPARSSTSTVGSTRSARERGIAGRTARHWYRSTTARCRLDSRHRAGWSTCRTTRFCWSRSVVPEGPDDVLPFLRNVTRGRGIPDERLAAVAEHYQHFGGVSPINEQCRELLRRDREGVRVGRRRPAGLLGQPQLGPVARGHRARACATTE